MTVIKARKGMPDVHIARDEFARRFREQFFDPAFSANRDQIDAIIDTAWNGYDEYRKNPRKLEAGPEFADPHQKLPVEWLETRRKIQEAQLRQQDLSSPPRILLINGSMRSDQTCPGEISKSWRLMQIARETLAADQALEIEELDLSHLTSQFGRSIHPCKACVSTAMPLCHWPCSCYPNFAMGQVNDWMADIYPMWVAAHGVMIVTPVNWYQAPAGLKAMIDRLVCADGGNPDPTTTSGKDPDKAKDIELKGWSYPRHLAGRVFSVVVHGDSAGVETLRRIMSDWLGDIGLIAAGQHSELGNYIGYMGSYAESHVKLDKDLAIQQDVRTAARSLANAVRMMRAGELRQPDEGLQEARPK